MNTRFKEKLFKIHTTGQIGDWQIIVVDNEDGTATMQRKARKVIGGKPVVTTTEFTEGKNIGRSNETTPIMQAIFEAQSRYKKQLDKGYVPELPQAGDKVTNSLGFQKPMLAQPIEKVKDWNFPIHVQPKLDGHRLLATVQDRQVVLYSRQGKVVSIDHIRNDLQYRFDNGHWDGTTLDGEVYLHGETLQRISSLVKKPKPESRELVYHIYDIMVNEPYSHRLGMLWDMFKHSIQTLVLIESKMIAQADGLANLDDYHAQCLADGYEGTIIRHGDTGYEEGKRSKSLMKKKDFQDAEFEIISIETGKPYIKPEGTFQVPVFVCRAHNGKVFNCTAPGTMHEKDALYNRGADLLGKMLTVKFFNLTPDGVPFLPVALRLRDDI